MRRLPKPPLPVPESNGRQLEEFKLSLMRLIDEDLARRFSSLKEAAPVVGVSYDTLCRIRSRDQSRFSVVRLIRMAARFNIRITVDAQVTVVRRIGGG